METFSLFQTLRSLFDTQTQSWVINALRQDQVVWNSLQDARLFQKALSACGSDPHKWSPGFLSLLVLNADITLDYLLTSPLQPLDADLHQLAYQAYENLVNNKAGSESFNYSLNSDTESSSQGRNPPYRLIHVDALATAGLIGLGLRERLRLIGSWSGFCQEMLKLTETTPEGWFTPFACLFGLIPEPNNLLTALMFPGASVKVISLALHAFLSNPLPFTEQLKILQEVFANNYFQKVSKPSEISPVVRVLSLRDQELAKDLSGWLLQDGKLEAQINTQPKQSTQVEAIIENIHLAEIYQTAGQTEKAFSTLAEARRTARQLQAGLAAFLATTAELAQPLSTTNAHQDLILNAWKEAVDFASEPEQQNSSTPFETNLTRARLQTRKHQTQSVDEELGDFSSETFRDFETWLAMAQIAHQQDDLTRARQYALNALVAELEKTPRINDGLSQPLQANLLRGKQRHWQELASLLYDLELYPECIRILNRSLSISPNDPDLLFQLGKALQASYNQKEANQAFQIALMLSPDRLDIHTNLAEGLEAEGEWNNALIERQNILTKIDPENSTELKEAYHALANCALRTEQPDLAVEASDKVLSITPEDGLAYVIKGEASFRKSNLQESLEHFKQAVQYAPHLPEPWLGLVKAYRATGQADKVIDTLKEAIQAAPLSYEVHFTLGEEYLANGEQTQACMLFQRAFELINATNRQPGEYYWKICLRLGQTLLRLGHLLQAHEVLENAYNQARMSGSIPPELAYAYAKTLLVLNKVAQAIPVLREAFQDEPQDSFPYLDYVKALLETGSDPQEAVRVAQLALEKDAGLLEAHALLAEAFSASGDHPNALKAFQIALETELSKDRKWVARLSYGMGCSALALGYIDAAIAALQEAIHAEPSIPAFHQKLCEAYWAANLYNNAIQAARSTLNLGTENPDILMWFAEQAVRFYQSSNPKNQPPSADSNFEEAQTDHLYGIKPKQVLTEAMNALSQAALLSPERADVCLKLGELQLLAGEKKQAIESFRQVISKQSITLADLEKAADWLFQLGENHASVACLERAVLLLNEQQVEIPCQLMEKLAQAYWQSGDIESAIETLHLAISKYPQKVHLYLKIARVLIKSNREEQALTCLKESLNILIEAKDRSLIFYHVAQIQRSFGDLPQALEYAEQALLISENEDLAEKFDWMHLAKHYLAAELARAVLKPKAARAHLEERNLALLTAEQLENLDSEALDTLIGFYCLKSELALDDGEEIEAANALTPAVQVASTHPRTLALQSRFQHRRGDDSLALRTLHEALIQLPIPKEFGGSGLENYRKNTGIHYPNPHISIEERGFSSDVYLSLSEAAVELYIWDLAQYLIERAIEANPEEIYLKLCKASVLVRKAEHQYLCQTLDVITHAPGDEALSIDNARTFYDLIQTIKQAFPQDSGVESSPTLPTWECRGLAVFSDVLDGTGISHQDPDWTAVPQSAETIAAELAYLRRKASQYQRSQPTYGASIMVETVSNPEAMQTWSKVALQASRLFPKSALVQLMGGLLLEILQPDQAFAVAKQAVNIQQTSLTSQTAMSNALLARLALRSRDLQLATQAINTALNIWQDEPRWYALAASITIQLDGYTQDVITHFRTATQLEPQNYTHHINLGLAYYHLARTDMSLTKEALRSFERATHLEHKRPDAWMHLAETCLLEGTDSSLKQAALWADRAIILAVSEAQPQTALECYLLRAEIALRAGEYNLAEQNAQKVLDSEPSHAKAAWLKAHALENMNRPAEALSVLERVVHQDAEPLSFQLKKVALCRQTQEPEAVLKRVSDLAEKNPNHPEVLSLLAQILADAGQKEAALQAAQLALQPYPDHELTAQEKARLHHMIGSQAAESGQLDKAIYHLNEAIQLDPGFVEPYLELGFAYNKQRQYLKAQNIFQQATTIAPSDPRPFLHTGLAFKEGKDYQSAEAMLRRAAQLAPSDVRIRKHLAAVAALNLVHNPHNIHIAAER